MITIQREPDASIEPGHQVLVLPYNREGEALARLLTGDMLVWCYIHGEQLRIPHDAIVDARMVALINLLADIRYQAPQLLQLTMVESIEPVMRIVPEDSGS